MDYLIQELRRVVDLPLYYDNEMILLGAIEHLEKKMNYYNCFEAGYKDGYINGKHDSYDEAYDFGYNDGLIKGCNEGYKEGIDDVISAI